MSARFNQITELFSVAPQLEVSDVAAIKSAGFKSVIINRPDHELSPLETTSSAMITAVKEAGLVVHYQPVVACDITLENIQEFKQLYTDLPKPILAYCRSGMRCANLYELAQQS